MLLSIKGKRASLRAFCDCTASRLEIIRNLRRGFTPCFVFGLFLLIIVLFFYPDVVYSEGTDNETRKDQTVISLTLEQAINLALQANRSLLVSASGVESQQLSLSSAESQFELKILPSTSADISDHHKSLGVGICLDKKFKIGTRASLSPRIERLDDDYSGKNYSGKVGLSLDIPLLRGFGKDVNLDSVLSSQFSVRNSERSLYLTRVNTVLDTVSAVYNIIEEKELVRLFESLVERLQGDAENARIKEKVGMATPIDIYRAEIRLKDAEDSLTQAQEALQSAEDALKLILAMPMEEPIAVSAPFEYEPIRIDVDGAVEIALNNRVELEQAKDQIRETKRRSGVYKHNLLPQLDLVLDYEKYGSSDEFGQSMRFDEDRWSINFVGATDWARTSEKAAFQQSLISIRTARLDLEARQDEITREVRWQLEALTKSEERIRIRKEQIEQAEGKLALARIKFDHGMANNFDVIEAETELQRARVDLLSMDTEYIVGTYGMRAALGTLIER